MTTVTMLSKSIVIASCDWLWLRPIYRIFEFKGVTCKVFILQALRQPNKTYRYPISGTESCFRQC